MCFHAVIYAASIEPIPYSIYTEREKVILGNKLFNDTRLSINDTISCASCHILKDGGDDNQGVSIGIDGKLGEINSPTVLNAAFNFRQFWDGRVKTLKEQALGPIENPVEMGNTFEKLIVKLSKTEYYELFNEIYDDGITKDNIVDAIAEFEKTLITPNAPFDKYLRGDEDAISKTQKEGFELFKNKGCIACHHGVNVGGNLYNKFGIIEDSRSSNLGKYNHTKDKQDKYYFKVPTLRNIELTAPYFHDARTSSLHEAVNMMALLQLGRPISHEETNKIVEFLKSLTGELPKDVK